MLIYPTNHPTNHPTTVIFRGVWTLAQVKMVGRVYRFRMRVPRRFSDVETRGEIDVSLKTSDLQVAEGKAANLRGQLVAMWEARMAGEDPDCEAIIKYCQTMGFAYRPIGEQTQVDFMDRVSHVDVDSPVQVQALLGARVEMGFRTSEMAQAYEDISRYRLRKKNSEQLRIWRIPFRRAAAAFIGVAGDLRMEDVGNDEAQKFRDQLRGQVESGAIVANTANRLIGSMQTMFKEICRDKKVGLPNPFNDLRLRETKTKGRRRSVPREMIDRVLVPGALARLNDEARDILLICINTGCRPSEICGVRVDQMHLEANVPHFDLIEDGRELKTAASVRQVVLVGIALEAARRRKMAGGFIRYEGRHSSLTGLINKFLRNNGLLDDGYSLYGFRHSFEDRLTAQKLPDRIAAELMGHEVRRERYGDGPDLQLLAETLAPISFY